MKNAVIVLVASCIAFACSGCKPDPTGGKSLSESKANHKTVLRVETSSGEPVEEPPKDVFKKIQYNAAPGKMWAYLTPDPKDKKKHPAIVWITGGDCNTVGDVWTEADADNEQTASAYRKSGLVMMFPSLRGGNTNPGVREGFYGEVYDVIDAARFLAAQPYVDPKRIYLGGHSSGGTLALLVAAEAPAEMFRGVFAFGPIEDVSLYPPDLEVMCFDTADKREVMLRSPIHWLKNIQTQTFVFEGSRGNYSSLVEMRAVNSNDRVKFLAGIGTDHFGVLAPTNELIAKKILADTGASPSLNITKDEMQQLFGD